jgi:hypothetical protein
MAPEKFVVEQVLELFKRPSVAQSAFQALQHPEYSYRDYQAPPITPRDGAVELWLAAYFGLTECCKECSQAVIISKLLLVIARQHSMEPLKKVKPRWSSFCLIAMPTLR